MKSELLNIISKKYAESVHLDAALEFSARLLHALEDITDQTKSRFTAFLQKYNFETIPTFSEYPEYPTVTLFKGVDSWTLCPVIDYEGGVTDMDQEIGLIFADPEIYISDDNLSGLGFELKEIIILTWLCKLWFDINGDSYGILVKTLENNSTASFFLNDLAWDDLSEFREFNDKNKRSEPYFIVKPDLLSIFQRVVLKTYPVYPYINKWRFFRKGEDILKFVSYGNETEERSANASTQILKEHKTLFDALKYEQTRTFELNKSGYTEFLPGKPLHDPIYEGAIETRFHSGQHWYYKELENRLDIKQISVFEKQNSISLPFYFRHYLRLFNGRKYNLINQYYSTGSEFLKVKEFYNLDELQNSLDLKSPGTFLGAFFKRSRNTNLEWLDIAILDEENKKLSLNLSTSKLAIKEDNKYQELEVDFETFIKEPRNY